MDRQGMYRRDLARFFMETQVSRIRFWLNHHLWFLMHSHTFTDWFAYLFFHYAQVPMNEGFSFL